MAYWLMKSEPDVYSIDDLKRDGVNMWEGCRNYTVRNFFRDKFAVGDLAFFHHSNADPAGIVGIMEVVRTGYPDPTQFDPKSEYFDAKADPENPRWMVVDVKFVEKFDHCITLPEMRANPALEKMLVLQRGQRLSVMPVAPEEWSTLLEMARAKTG
jgi:predicted RNA-binding protein with PUA-like domain